MGNIYTVILKKYFAPNMLETLFRKLMQLC